MAAKSKALVTLDERDGADILKVELPAYAVRYLKQMCARERGFLINVHQAGGYNTAIVEAASDALLQIERAIT